VVVALDMPLGEGLVGEGNLIESLARQGHLRERLAQSTVKLQSPLRGVDAINQATRMVGDHQCLIDVDRVEAKLLPSCRHAVDEFRLPPLVSRMDVRELDDRLDAIPDPPHRRACLGVQEMVGLELLVEGVQRIDAEVVEMRHHAEAQVVRALDERGEARRRRVVRVVPVIGILTPGRDVEQRLSGIAPRR